MDKVQLSIAESNCNSDSPTKRRIRSFYLEWIEQG
jgi:hypothetical protein